MKPLIGLVAIFVSTVAFAQNAPPKAEKKPPVRSKPLASMGCKLVGAVRGTRIWAGECVATPAPESAPATPAEPSVPSEKE
jgi:hypothetical protein